MIECRWRGMLMPAFVVGCGQNDRVAGVALTANRQQSEQNQRMVDLHHELVAGTKLLVEADSKARQEMVELHRDVGDQLAEVSRQRDRLDEERRSLGEDRRRESVIARAIENVGAILASLLPLAVCLVALWPRAETPVSDELASLLIEDLVASEPRLLVRELRPEPPIGQDERQAGRLPGPGDDTGPQSLGGPLPEGSGLSDAAGDDPPCAE